MTKFCTICGNKLEEGEICACQKGQQPSGQNFQSNQGQQPSGQNNFQSNQAQQPSGQNFQPNQGQAAVPNNIGVYFNRLWHVVTQTIKTPADMLKQYTEASDSQVAFGFIGAQAIAFALLLVILFGKLNTVVSSTMGIFSYYLGGSSFEFPLAKIFITTVVLSVLLSVAFAGVLLFFTKVVFKGETDFMKMICVAGAKSLAVLPFTVVAILLVFINIYIAISIFSIGSILGYFYAAQALKGAVKIDENKSVYILFLSFAAMVIVNGITIKSAIPEILPSISSILK